MRVLGLPLVLISQLANLAWCEGCLWTWTSAGTVLYGRPDRVWAGEGLASGLPWVVGGFLGPGIPGVSWEVPGLGPAVWGPVGVEPWVLLDGPESTWDISEETGFECTWGLGLVEGPERTWDISEETGIDRFG